MLFLPIVPIATLALAGCAAGPDYARPDLAMPAAASARASAALVKALGAGWNAAELGARQGKAVVAASGS